MQRGSTFVAPIIMTKIQVILFFTKINKLTSTQQQSVLNIVTEEYCRRFNCKKSDLQIQLYNGSSKLGDKYDIILAIDSERKMINEGSLRNDLRKAIANKLSMIIPRTLNFRGQIATKDGNIDETPNETLKSNNTTDGDPKDDPKQEMLARIKNYVAEDPKISFDMLQIPDATRKTIEQSLKRIELEGEVFDEWGLYAIMPNPVCALSLYGTPGSGKTMAADAIADHLKKKIIRADYAEIESKYHGEGPKNVDAIFRAAEEQDAILFIDEADSLLSKRLTNVTQGSEQAINSMRAQILICLERFHGVVIFATNLVVNYDKAFLSRLISIEFPFPDAELREKIWRAHLLPTASSKVKLKIPLADDIDFKALAKNYEICGRVIRNVVVNACVEARANSEELLTQTRLLVALNDEIERAKKLSEAQDHTDTHSDNRTGIQNISPEGKKALVNAVKKIINNTENTIFENE